MLLVAAAPIVRAAGSRALTVALLVLALAAVAALGVILLKVMELRWGSREGWLLLAVLCGWQPVLAGVRQTDIALPAAAAVLAAWYFLRSGRAAASGFAASIATCLAVPAVGILPALARSAPRAALVGALSLAALVTGTLAVAGLHTVAGFVMTLAYAARMWSIADTNYSVLGRAVTAAIPPIVIGLDVGPGGFHQLVAEPHAGRGVRFLPDTRTAGGARAVVAGLHAPYRADGSPAGPRLDERFFRFAARLHGVVDVLVAPGPGRHRVEQRASTLRPRQWHRAGRLDRAHPLLAVDCCRRGCVAPAAHPRTDVSGVN